MGTLRRATRRRRPSARGDPRLVSRRSRHALRREHRALSQGPHELGVRRRSRPGARLARAVHRAHATLRKRVVRLRRQQQRCARRMQRRRARDPRRDPPHEQGGRVRRALPLLLAVAAFFAVALIWIGSSRVASHAFDEGSTLNTSSTGTSLAYAYHGHRGMVNKLTTPLRSGAIPRNAIVFRIDSHPYDSVDEDDERGDKKTKAVRFFLTPADEEFARGGGRIVLASHYFGGSIEMRDDAGKVASKVFPVWPGLDTLTLPEHLGLAPRSLPRAMHTIFAGNGEAVVARQPIGAGDVIVVSVPEMFENGNLASGHHLALLSALADDGATERRPLAGWTAGGSPAVQPTNAAEPAAVH